MQALRPGKEARPDARWLQGEVPALRQRLCRHEARHLLDDRNQPRDHGRHRLSLLRHGWLRGAPHRRRRAAEPAGRRAWPRRLCRGPLPLQLAAVQQHVLRLLSGERPAAHRHRRAPAEAPPLVLWPPRPGRPHRDHHGRRPDHGARLQPRAGRALGRRHLHLHRLCGIAPLLLAAEPGRVLEHPGGLCHALREPRPAQAPL